MTAFLDPYSSIFPYGAIVENQVLLVGVNTIPGITLISGALAGSVSISNLPSVGYDPSASSGGRAARDPSRTIRTDQTVFSSLNQFSLANIIGSGTTGTTILNQSGVFSSTNNLYINGTLTISGTSSSVVVIRAVGTLTMENVTIILTGGILPFNVIWITSGNSSITNSNVIGLLFTNNAALNTSTITGSVYSATGLQMTTSTIAFTTPLACYVKGSKILTTSGYVCIEDLRVGDSVPTFGTISDIFTPEENAQRIKWIGKCFPALDEKTRPIRIKKEAFPELTDDLYVSPGHALIIDNKLVCARDLVNGITITPDDCTEVTYYHIELDAYSAVKANGILAETYLSSDTRRIFESIV